VIAAGPVRPQTATDKSPDAFRTISEVAEDLDLPQHVLRFWETRFTPIRPLKRGGGRRYYRPEDIDLLKGIRYLLYGQGYTIKGVQRILKEDGLRFVQAIGRGEQTIASAHRREPMDDGEDESEEIWRPDDVDDALGDLPPRGTPDSEAAKGTPLRVSGDDLDRLKAALDDLLECERILGTLKAE
jgi:DNA-binding transcriptional MerR regulator